MERRKTKFIGVYEVISQTKIFQSKPDICFYVTYKEQNKKIWKKIGWKSEGFSAAYANQERFKFLQKIRSGETKKTISATLDQAFAIYDREFLSICIKRPADERARFKRYISPVLGNKNISQIYSEDINKFYARLLEKKLSSSSIRLIIGDLRRIFKKFIEWGHLIENPVKIKHKTKDVSRTRFLTEYEAKKLLQMLDKRSPKWHDIAFISLNTGMRLTEVLHLERQDIDFGTNLIHIRDSKTGSRTIYGTKSVMQILKNRLPQKQNSRFFTKENGEAFADSYTAKIFRDCVKQCGFNPKGIDNRHRVCFHTLRHTFCSWLAMRGEPLYVIAEIVGHSSMEMTKKYSHLCPTAAKKAIKCLENIF